MSCGVDSLDSDGRVDAADIREPGLEQMVAKVELPSNVVSGEAVPMTLRVKNTGQDPATVGLTGRPTAFDFIVEAPDGTEVWSRLHGKTIAMVLELRTVPAGGVLEFTEEWDQRDNNGRPVEPGIYYVRGMLPAEDRELISDPQRLRISRR